MHTTRHSERRALYLVVSMSKGARVKGVRRVGRVLIALAVMLAPVTIFAPNPLLWLVGCVGVGACGWSFVRTAQVHPQHVQVRQRGPSK